MIVIIPFYLLYVHVNSPPLEVLRGIKNQLIFKSVLPRITFILIFEWKSNITIAIFRKLAKIIFSVNQGSYHFCDFFLEKENFQNSAHCQIMGVQIMRSNWFIGHAGLLIGWNRHRERCHINRVSRSWTVNS